MRSALDGDSLTLADGRQVRLIGINAPEFGSDGRPDQPLAHAARERVNALARGRNVRLRYDRERMDRYGRLLAYVFLPDGRDLQETLLREGLGWFVAVAPNTARLPIYRRSEARAQAERRGVWARPEYEPVAADQLPPGRSGFMRISGTVAAVHTGREGFELQLAPGVRLLVSRAIADSCAASPDCFRGKRVLARGWMTAYKGSSRMRITHPAMLEIAP